jgi:hypothetical protein
LGLSNGFSRKIENHMAAAALNYFAYDFCKIHTMLRVTPAMAAGITTRLMDVSDLVKLLIESEQEKPRRREEAPGQPWGRPGDLHWSLLP